MFPTDPKLCWQCHPLRGALLHIFLYCPILIGTEELQASSAYHRYMAFNDTDHFPSPFHTKVKVILQTFSDAHLSVARVCVPILLQ